MWSRHAMTSENCMKHGETGLPIKSFRIMLLSVAYAQLFLKRTGLPQPQKLGKTMKLLFSLERWGNTFKNFTWRKIYFL